MKTALALLLFFVAGVAADAAPRNTKDLVNDLQDKRLRVAAYRELMKRKDPKSVYPIQGLLPDLDSTGQVYGVNIIAGVGTKTATSVLKTLARLGDPHLRVTAGAALYRTGDRSAVLSMADALLSDDVTDAMRTLMIMRVYLVKEPAIATAVGQLLEPKVNHLVLYYALYLLHSQDARRIAPQAVRVLEDNRAAVRAMASAFLLRFGREEHAGPAAAAIRDGKLDSTWWVRVRFYLVAAPRIPPTILTAIAERLPMEADRTITLHMIYLLGQHGFRNGAPALRKRLDDGDRTIAGSAFDALLKIPGGLEPLHLSKRLADPEPAIRLKAADALRRHDDPSGLTTACKILKDGAPADRVAAAKVVAAFRLSEAVEPLLRALSDPRPDVRSAALAGLTRTFAVLYPYRRFNLPLTGYHPKLAPKQSAPAVERIRAWWKENRSKDW